MIEKVASPSLWHVWSCIQITGLHLFCVKFRGAGVSRVVGASGWVQYRDSSLVLSTVEAPPTAWGYFIQTQISVNRKTIGKGESVEVEDHDVVEISLEVSRL